MHFILHSFVLSFFGFYDLIFFFELFLELFLFSFQLVNYLGESLFDVFDVGCVYFCYSFLDVVDLELVLSLDCVEFLFEHVHFALELGSFEHSLFWFLFEAGEQFGDLVVFDGDHLSEAVEFDAEEFVVVFYVSFQVFEFEVEYFFELVPEFIELIAFFFVGFVVGCSLFFCEFL